MKITLSTIMRDGEPYVEYACRSTFSQADKIVIVDTGSKDNTIDIIRQVAKEYDKELILLETPWIGYGPSRELAMPHVEDGWLWKIGFQYRGMDPVGSTLTAWGKVIDKRQVGDYGIVECEIGLSNQDGVNGTPGTATAVFPLRGGKPIPYPFVPPKE